MTDLTFYLDGLQVLGIAGLAFTAGFVYAKRVLPWLWDRGLRSLAVALPAVAAGAAVLVLPN